MKKHKVKKHGLHFILQYLCIYPVQSSGSYKYYYGLVGNSELQ